MNSRRKGKGGELEWCHVLRELGYVAARGQQYHGGVDTPDVVGGIPGTHCEVKRRERLNIDDAIDQAIRDSGDILVPYVAHRRNRRPWLVTLRAQDLLAFSRRIRRQRQGDLL